MAQRDGDPQGRTGPRPSDGAEGGTVPVPRNPKPMDGAEGGTVPVPPVPPRPLFLQILSLILGLIAVIGGFAGAEGVLFIFCGLSVLANGASLLFEGATTAARAQRR